MGVAIVTGAGRPGAIGAAIAMALAEDGHDVCVSDVDDTRLASVAGAVAERGRRAAGVCADVRDPASVAALFDECEARLGAPTVVVANAAVAVGKPLLELTPEEWNRTVEVNLGGVFRTLTEAARRLLAASATGCLVVVSSAAAKTARAGLGAYSATKAGAVSLMQAAAAEWAPHGVRVNAVCPGALETEMSAPLYAGWAEALGVSYDEYMQGSVVPSIPVGRLAEPGEVAAVVAFLASDRASYVCGEAVNVSGGAEVH